MKAIDIALKDMLGAWRSAFALVMMFGAPLLMTGIFYLAFGRASVSSGGDLPLTQVQVVNLDQAAASTGSFVAGRVVLEVLQDASLAKLIQASEVSDADTARQAVDRKQAGVAVIIPPDLTAALASEGRATVVLYVDPTLTVGPNIVKGALQGLVDTFSASRIAAQVFAEQLEQRHLEANATRMQAFTGRYAEYLVATSRDATRRDPRIESPPGSSAPKSQSAPIAALIMAGMMIFFVFFTGASTAESIVKEDEEGTLPRLFTTPTPREVILAGKFAGVLMTIIGQVIVLLLASRLLFGIHWGSPLAVLLVSVGMVVAAAGFGVFVMSFVRNTRQTGPVMGFVLTITAMLGGLFTVGIQNLPPAFETINLFTPHGWALRGWKAASSGAEISAVWLPCVVMLAMGAAYFAVGAFFFRRRFASGG